MDNVNSKNEITIIPNPTTDIVTISQLPLKAELLLTDALGRVLLKKETQSNQEVINLGTYPPATYFVIIKTASEIITLSVVRK